MTHTEILFRHLGPRARRFVQQVEGEWNMYTSPYTKARAGCLQRDAIRWRITRLAYHRYTQTL